MHLSLFHGDEAEGPRVFALPPGADYAAGFAAGLATRLAGAPPEAMLAVQVLVNTRRAARSLEEALADRGGISFLPRLALLETAADQLSPALPAESLPPPVNPLLRHLSLLRLVAAWQGLAGGVFPEAAAPELAESLADLIDELDEAGLDGAALSAALPEGTAPELASHWARALEFLEIVRRHWPALREERMPGALDPAARLRASADRLIAAWAAAPPKTPLIVAGSTGSRPITAALMAAIARLDQGAVVLPGFDTTIEPASWENAGPDHPMAPFRGFLERLALRPADIRPWLPDSTPHGPRHRLLAEALRPAPVTDAWAARRPELAALAEDATAGITLVKAAHPRAEAAALALAIRRALETPGQTIAVVTRDARLARRLTAELERFGVLPDDSLGRPLALAPAGIFAGLVLDAAMTPGDPVALAALLGHPFCRAGQERAHHRRLARFYERQVLRERGLLGGPGAPLLPPWPEREADPETAMRESWRAGIAQALAPLAEALAAATPLATTIAHHRAAIDALAATPDEDAAHPFDDGADGRALDRLFATLSTAAAADGGAEAGTKLGGPAYAALLGRLMRAETLRPEGALPHPRVAIWGTMEARTAAADLTIIAGLNEGVWPPVPDTGPWLSRPMRAALGLPAPERAVGLSAHDFLQAASRPQVILSRSLSDEGAPTVASRWLLRIETLLAGTAPEALTAMGKRGEELLDLLPALDLPGTPDDPALRTPDDPALRPAERPCPRPPQSARPRTLSATDLETLIRDPYAVYAHRVLGLRPLDPLGAPADARDRGTVMHRIMEAFVATAPPDPIGPQAEADRLIALGEEIIARDVPEPAQARFWRARLARAALAIAEGELARRVGIVESALERRGRIALPLPTGPFTLTARADRIDRRADGAGNVYDYKSSLPTAKQIGIFQHQLHLQALILGAGGFDGLPALPPGEGAYIGLAKGGEVRPKEPLADTLPAYRDRLLALLSGYDDEEQGYLSLRAIQRTEEEGNYDHLARRAEWEGGDG